jgi:hypothetical protein
MATKLTGRLVGAPQYGFDRRLGTMATAHENVHPAELICKTELSSRVPEYCSTGYFASLEQTAILALMAKALYHPQTHRGPSSS